MLQQAYAEDVRVAITKQGFGSGAPATAINETVINKISIIFREDDRIRAYGLAN